MNIGKRNLLAGKLYEDEIAGDLNDLRLFPPLGSSQDYDKEADKRKIDIVPKNSEDIFPYHIQAKVSTNKLQYPKLLSQMNEVRTMVEVVETPAIIFHKYNTKSTSGRFMTRAKYAILNQQDFINIIEELAQYKQGFGELMAYWDSISDEEQPELNERLKKLGL